MLYHFSLKSLSVKIFIFFFFQIFSIAVFAQQDSINFIHAIPVDIQSNSIIVEWQTPEEVLSGVYYTMEGKNSSNFMVASAPVRNHTYHIPAFYPSQLIYVLPFQFIGSDTLWGDTLVLMSRSASSGKIRVYFTRPVDPNVATGPQAIYLPGTAADTVIKLIHQAKKSIDLAIYNMNIDGIAYALNQAKERGVRVRVIYDGSTTNSSIYVLQGVPMLASPTSSSYGIMHNKFMVIDCDTDNPNDAILFTGSMNFTSTQVTKDANNILIIQDKSLALAYRIEFEEMWGGSGSQPNSSASRFGPYKKNNTPHYFNVGGIPIESWFSPSDGVNSKIIAAINSSNTSLFIPTNLITRDDLANAIAKRRQNEVLCRVVVDNDASCSDQVVAILTEALGTNFRETTESGILHHKVLIADALQTDSNPVVLTGSHNWSNNAETRNDENTLILYDADIANLYYQEFSQRFKQSRAIAPNPVLDLGPDISVCAGQKVLLDAGTGFSSYSWSNGSTASQIIVDTSGIGLGNITTSCTVNNVYGTQTDQITITFFACTGIEDNYTKNHLLIYPNPCREFFRIQLPPDAKPQFIEIYNIQGQMVMQQTTRLVGNSLEINVSELNPGIYIVRVLAGNKVYVVRLLKQ